MKIKPSDLVHKALRILESPDMIQQKPWIGGTSPFRARVAAELRGVMYNLRREERPVRRCEAATCERPFEHDGPHSSFDGPRYADEIPDENPEGDAEPLVLGAPVPLADAIRRACEEPSLVDALTWIAIWESERVVAQALRNDRTGERGPNGEMWDTCFRFSLSAVLNAYGRDAARAATSVGNFIVPPRDVPRGRFRCAECGVLRATKARACWGDREPCESRIFYDEEDAATAGPGEIPCLRAVDNLIVEAGKDIRVHLRRAADGVTRDVIGLAEFGFGPPENVRHWWTEGNGACDCNRSIFFFRARRGDDAAEAPPEGHPHLCQGGGRFWIVKPNWLARYDLVARGADGTVIKRPVEDPKARP